MSVFRQDDGHGHSIRYLDIDGYITCTFTNPEETAKNVREMANFKCRPDDIFVCAPVKSGTHWTWEIISMMYQGKAETIPKSKICDMMEASPWALMEKLPSPRILNTHLHYSRLPKQAKEMGCKIVYVLRNPKDVAVSLYHHNLGINVYEYDGNWEHFLPLFIQGKTEYNSWFEYVLEWEEVMSNSPDLPIHLIYYEDLIENNLKEVCRLGNFLGIENRDDIFEAISEKCQFDNMVKDKKQYLLPDVGASPGDGFTFYRKVNMSVYKQDDGHGHSMTLLNTDGFTSPSFFDPEGTAHRIREMVNFRCRPDDIFICAPVKSGTHWTWEIISMMYQGTADTITRSKISYMIEASPWDQMENLPSPRAVMHIFVQ